MADIDKIAAVAILAALEVIDLIWGIDWMGATKQQAVGVILAILMPLAVWLVPSRGATGRR